MVELKNNFVKEYYNDYLKKLSDDYTRFRWFATPVDLLDYKQTGRSLNKEIFQNTYESILEIGPGDGVWTKDFLNKTKDYVVVDQSEEMLARLKEKFSAVSYLKYYLGDFNEVQLNQQFSLVVAVRCFEYFDKQAEALLKMSSLLKIGGELVIVTKNRSYISSAAKQANKTLHQGQLDKKTMLSLARQAGFQVISAYPATLRIKANWKVSRFFFNLAHQLVVLTKGKFNIPYFFDKCTESYLYHFKK